MDRGLIVISSNDLIELGVPDNTKCVVRGILVLELRKVNGTINK